LDRKITELDGCRREIEITLTNDELKPHFDKAYKEAQKDIDLKGFRKGKVPINVIKQYYGKRIEAAAIEDIGREVFSQVIKDDELHVLGKANIFDINKNDSGITFKIYYDVLPDFVLADYRGLTIDEPVYTVSDDEIQEELNKISVNTGKLEPDETISDDYHIASLKLSVIDAETQLPIIGEKPIETSVYLASDTVIPELKASLLNTKNGDSFIFKPRESDPNAPDKTYRVEVSNIKKIVPEAINNEFVTAYTSGKLSTVDEFKEEIGFQIQENWNHKSRQAMEDQIINKLVEMHDFPVPESLVIQVIESMTEDIKKQYSHLPDADKITAESMHDELNPLSEKLVKWEIIKNKIIEKEHIEVEDFDIDGIVEAEANRTKGDPQSIRRAIMQNKNLMDNILNKKIMDFILDFAVTNEVPFDEHGHYHPVGEHHHHEDDEEH
jgi:trigger factor